MNKPYKYLLPVLLIGFMTSGLFAQVRQTGGQGRAIDRSYQVGAGRINSSVPNNYMPGSRGFFSLRNSRGLTSFRGNLPSSFDSQLRSNRFGDRVGFGTSALSSFRQQSVSLGDVLSGRGLYDPQSQVYNDPLRSGVQRSNVLDASKTGGLVKPGVVNRTAAGRDTLADKLYRDALTGYNPLVSKDYRLGGNAIGIEPEQLRRQRAEMAKILENQQIARRGGEQLFGMLRQRDRESLTREINELKDSRLFGGDSDKKDPGLDTRIDRMIREETRKGKLSDKLIRDPQTGRLRPLRPGEKRPDEDTRFTPGMKPDAKRELPQVNKDAFLDLLRTLREKQAAEGEDVQPTPGDIDPTDITPTRMEAKLRNVNLDKNKDVIIHDLAGKGADRFNLYMKQGKDLLKRRRYYSAARKYELANMVRPQNPLAHVGACLSSFGAGEWFTSATAFRQAVSFFPPLMEVKLDLPKLMDVTDFDSRLADLDRWIKTVDARPEMLMLSAYFHYNRGNMDTAKTQAKALANHKLADDVQKSFAKFILTGESPSKKVPTDKKLAPKKLPAK